MAGLLGGLPLLYVFGLLTTRTLGRWMDKAGCLITTSEIAVGAQAVFGLASET
jgi:hypothetical protein